MSIRRANLIGLGLLLAACVACGCSSEDASPTLARSEGSAPTTTNRPIAPVPDAVESKTISAAPQPEPKPAPELGPPATNDPAAAPTLAKPRETPGLFSAAGGKPAAGEKQSIMAPERPTVAKTPEPAAPEPKLAGASEPPPSMAAAEPAKIEPPRANPLRGNGPPEEAKPEPAVPAPVSKPDAASDPASGKPVPPARKGKHSGIPFDPIKENGPIFVDWPKPRLVLVLSGRQDGYLEPCGCAGLDRMKGGLSRRHTMFQKFQADGWPVLALDVGGFVKSYGRQAEMKFQLTAEALRLMGYEAIALGKADLRLPTAELVAVVAGVQGKESRYVSSNVGLFGFDAKLLPRMRVVEAGGLRVGVAAVLGQKYQKEAAGADLEMLDPIAAVEKILPELQKQKCNLLVLLAHAAMDETQELAKRFPAFDLVVTAGGPPEPPSSLPPVIGEKTRIVEVGEKGMNVVVIGLFDDGQGGLSVRYQRVPLDSRFAQSTAVKTLMKSYQDQLKQLGLAGLGIRPVPSPQAATHGAFVGSQKCESCHEPSFAVWKKSGHAKAYATLVKADPPRNFDPECISCHVVGWHPTQFFPYQGGFLSTETTPHLTDVGCESCHGPGEKHVAVEIKGSEEDRQQYRKAMVLTKAEAKKRFCYECHDLDNSPDFDFDAYWPLVEHSEKE